MNKQLKMIIKILLFILIIAAFIFIGTKDFSKKVIVDNEKFDVEYSQVSKDNVFVYTDSQKVYTKFRNDSAIIFMGFASNKWSGYYANLLNTAAKEVGIKEILYYDFQKDRASKNATYESIVLKLKNYLYENDEGHLNINAPTLIIIKNGNIIYFDDETAINKGNVNPDIYWNEDNKNLKINEFKIMFQEFLGSNR